MLVNPTNVLFFGLFSLWRRWPWLGTGGHAGIVLAAVIGAPSGLMRRGRRVTVVARRAWLVSLVVLGILALLPACDWPWTSPGAGPAPTPTGSPGPRRI